MYWVFEDTSSDIFDLSEDAEQGSLLFLVLVPYLAFQQCHLSLKIHWIIRSLLWLKFNMLGCRPACTTHLLYYQACFFCASCWPSQNFGMPRKFYYHLVRDWESGKHFAGLILAWLFAQEKAQGSSRVVVACTPGLQHFLVNHLEATFS